MAHCDLWHIPFVNLCITCLHQYEIDFGSTSVIIILCGIIIGSPFLQLFYKCLHFGTSAHNYVIHCGTVLIIGTCAVIECDYGTVIDFCFIYLFIFCYPLGFYGTCAVIECHYGIFIILFFCYPLDFYGTCAVIVLLKAVIDCIIIVIITGFYGTCAVIEYCY